MVDGLTVTAPVIQNPYKLHLLGFDYRIQNASEIIHI